eukprot:TRINITY_DN66051_c11_g3_i2.p1 TRINITY_DN66051_c11_g3~~TRINITY_DN66051_c11_g3_i2.p1  ORF type:complete len:612 (-),score=159.59 TRINITY_DN66051_c11_g3_i2:269-1897(-)
MKGKKQMMPPKNSAAVWFTNQISTPFCGGKFGIDFAMKEKMMMEMMNDKPDEVVTPQKLRILEVINDPALPNLSVKCFGLLYKEHGYARANRMPMDCMLSEMADELTIMPAAMPIAGILIVSRHQFELDEGEFGQWGEGDGGLRAALGQMWANMMQKADMTDDQCRMQAVQKAQMMMGGMDWDMKCPMWLWSEDPQDWMVGKKWPEAWELPEMPMKEEVVKPDAKARAQQSFDPEDPKEILDQPEPSGNGDKEEEPEDEMMSWSDEQKMWWSERVYDRKSECEQWKAKVPVLAAMGNIYKIKKMKMWSAWNAVAMKIYEDGMMCSMEKDIPEIIAEPEKPEINGKFKAQEMPDWTIEQANMFLDWHSNFVCNMAMMTDINVEYGPSAMDKMRGGKDGYGKGGDGGDYEPGYGSMGKRRMSRRGPGMDRMYWQWLNGMDDYSYSTYDGEWEGEGEGKGDMSGKRGGGGGAADGEGKKGGKRDAEEGGNEMCGNIMDAISMLKDKVMSIADTMDGVNANVKSVKNQVAKNNKTNNNKTNNNKKN